MTETQRSRHLLPAPVRRVGYVLSGMIVAWSAYTALVRRKPSIPETAQPGNASASTPGIPGREAISDSGRPLNGPLPGGPIYTNESLRPYLRNQEKTMGIQKILQPDATEGPEAQDMVRQMEAQFGQAVQLRRPASVRLSGSKPDLLSQSESAPGGAAGKPLPETPGAAEANSPAYRLEGAVVRDDAQLRELWAQLGTPEPPPAVDFPRQMLVAVYAEGAGAKPGIEIISIKPSGGRLFVRYRLLPTASGSPPHQTRVLDRSDDAAVFLNDERSPTETSAPPSP